MFIPLKEKKTWPIFTDLVFQPGLIFCTFVLRMVLQSQAISILFSAAAETQQRQNFKVPTRLSSLWKGGGKGSAWHLLFTFQATVESSHGPSREACVHLIHPCVWMPAQRFCSFVSCSPNAHTRTQESQHADAITSQIKFLIWGPPTLLNWVQGGLCLFHKWLWIVNSPFSCLLPALGKHSILSVKYHMAFDCVSLWD